MDQLKYFFSLNPRKVECFLNLLVYNADRESALHSIQCSCFLAIPRHCYSL